MDSELPVFALAWVTCEGEPLTPMGQGGRILFVEHPQRGWEIPGGHLEEHEQPEDALLRELKEETGMIGRLVSWNKTYLYIPDATNFFTSATEFDLFISATNESSENDIKILLDNFKVIFRQ